MYETPIPVRCTVMSMQSLPARSVLIRASRARECTPRHVSFFFPRTQRPRAFARTSQQYILIDLRRLVNNTLSAREHQGEENGTKLFDFQSHLIPYLLCMPTPRLQIRDNSCTTHLLTDRIWCFELRQSPPELEANSRQSAHKEKNRAGAFAI